MSLVINIYLYHMFYQPLLIEYILFISLTYIGLSIFFSLNLYFLTNSELITNSMTLLSNNVSTITPSCISILSSLIFTITSFNMSLLFRLQQNVFSTTLESIANLLLLRSNQGLSDLYPHLNYFVCFLLQSSFSVHYFHISVFYPSQFYFLLLYSYNSLLNV